VSAGHIEQFGAAGLFHLFGFTILRNNAQCI